MNPTSTSAKSASNFRVSPRHGDEATLPAGFIVVCALTFAASVTATIYFCRSMCGGMEMPGGWTMSMMWMQMNGSWLASTIGFLLMWLAMMVAMMLPSVLPTFLKTKRAPLALLMMATGYFAVWLAFGIGIYALGVAFAAATMRWEILSRAVPVLSGTALIAAGAYQFTRWKLTGLLRCRSRFGCVSVCPEFETSFRLGCKQGAACCACCVPPMMVQLVLGIMNPLVMVIVAIVIAAEKLMPKPGLIASISGCAALGTGLFMMLRLLF